VRTYGEAVRAFAENFDLLDTAAGRGGKDGIIGGNDLRALLKNPDAPPRLKSAVRFLLRNPAFLHQLDVAAGRGCVDGMVTREDVDAASGSQPRWQAGAQPGSRAGASATQPTPDTLDAILADPTMTLEDRVVLFLMTLMNQMNEDIEAQTKRVANLRRKGAKGDDKAKASLDTEITKLERMVEKRKQLFNTLKAIIKKYDETANATIQAMGR